MLTLKLGMSRIGTGSYQNASVSEQLPPSELHVHAGNNHHSAGLGPHTAANKVTLGIHMLSMRKHTEIRIRNEKALFMYERAGRHTEKEQGCV